MSKTSSAYLRMQRLSSRMLLKSKTLRKTSHYPIKSRIKRTSLSRNNRIKIGRGKSQRKRIEIQVCRRYGYGK